MAITSVGSSNAYASPVVLAPTTSANSQGSNNAPGRSISVATASVSNGSDATQQPVSPAGSNGMVKIIEQALGRLGVSVPPPSASTATSTSASTASSTNTPAVQQQAANIQADIHNFMNAMFAATATAAPTASFSSGLAAIISQTGDTGDNTGSGGTTTSSSPMPELQSAYDQLLADLQSLSTSSAATAPSGSDVSSVSLRKLLGQIQQAIDYGKRTMGAAGSTLNMAA